MKIYLENTPLQTALQSWFNTIRTFLTEKIRTEIVSTVESLNRVTAEAVSAKISSPFFHASAMDGYAVAFRDTFGASETTPLLLSIPDKAMYLNTGDPVPDGFSAVVKIEDVNFVKKNDGGELNEFIEIIAPVTPWQNVRLIGEDIVATELIVTSNHRIRPIDVAAMVAGGINSVSVKQIPFVAIIPTGDEIVDPGKELREGEIIDTNSWMLAGLLSQNGASPKRWPIVPDRKEVIRDVLKKAVTEADMVLIIAGSSAGKEDFTAEIIAEVGEVVVHGVNIKPGKPVILGVIDGKLVIGIPGYPVSAYLAFDLFVKPVLEGFYGTGIQKHEMVTVTLSRQISSSLGVEEFVRVKLGNVSGKVVATPIGRGAGLIMSLVRADGLLDVPAMSEGFGAGSEVTVQLLRKREDINNTLVCIGSHDNTLDIIANHLKKRYPLYSLSSAHVGSMGGILAIKNREAHIAGTHLYDEETGEYNVPFVRKFLGDMKLRLVNLVYREQGLMVKKGNPKSIKSIRDLVRSDVVFINRQPGSGTRLLTDKCLRDFTISPGSVKGYDRVEFTHMAVASAVQSGVADAGVGIYASSVALGLDFIPIARERYDLIIPGEYAEDEKMLALLGIISDDMEFRTGIMKLGGYDVSDMGRIMYEQ